MKKCEPKFSVGSLYICSKCGHSTNESDIAEKLKSQLRADLKKSENISKIRVIVGGCLGVCEKDQQTVAYYPNIGNLELYTTELEYSNALKNISLLLEQKLN